ncbi:MAG: dTMP kinase [Hyphomicrobiaceae bacterium]
MARGRFITLEGGEGSGKSTQARLLAEKLCAAGISVVPTREPGGTPIAEQIREIILASRPAPDTEFLLFSAARAEHIAKRILPALVDGNWVVCDRYVDSTRVYQGIAAGIDARLMRAIEDHVVKVAWPDLTIIFDIAPDAGRARAVRRGALSRYDAENDGYHAAIRDGFLAIARAEPQRCVVVDASRDSAIIADDVWRLVQSRFGTQAG